MVELYTFGVDLRDLFPRVGFNGELADIKLKVLAVGADDRFGETDRFISASPMESGFKHNLFVGITLGFVESGSGFWFTEDIGDTVVADPISGAEVGVGVVVEGTPADTAGVVGV